MFKRAGVVAGLGIKVHAHMLRHACGFEPANDGIDRAQQYPEYDPLYGTGVGSVQELLAGLTRVDFENQAAMPGRRNFGESFC
jgi:hypothetical protein